MLEEQLKLAGINISNIGEDYENLRKTVSFQEKYKGRLKNKTTTTYYIKNEKNDIEIFLESTNVFIKSFGKVDLNDIELNEFLCSYKKLVEDKTLSVVVCENCNKYDY